MAIEIIPKAKKPRPRAELIDAALYLLLILLLLSFLSYFVLDYYQRRARVEIERIEGTLREKKSPAIKLLEERVLKTRERIATFAELWSAHQRSSRVFPFLANLSHPQVSFSHFELSPKMSKVVLSGSTESFRTLQEQILIFEEEPLIEEVVVERIELDPQGKASFSLRLHLGPAVLK